MSMPQAQFDDMVGRQVLGRYRVVRLLARGGMGSIYLARNKGAAGFVRPAVVKKILPSYLGDASAVQMFAREARIMSNLRHPGIVNIIDFAEEDGAYIMVLEYIHGTHTGRWVRYLRKLNRPFPVELGLQIMILTLDALDYAHTATALDGTPLAIIHRDIKPSNILVDVSGHVKLADFGIARAPNDKTEVSSGTTKLKGTFPYLAPEIFDDAEPSPGTDVYACGVVLHTLLTGRNEFSAKEVSTTIMRVLDHVPTPLDEARTDVSEALSRVVARSMDKDPTKRYQTAAEFAAALRNARSLAEAEANELLKNAANRDFRDSRFAQLLGIDDLSTLERALTSDGDEVTLEIATDPSVSSYPSADARDETPTSYDKLPRIRVEDKGRLDEPTRSERRVAISTERVDALPAAPTSRSWPLVLGLIGGASLIGAAIVVASMYRSNEPAPVVIVDKTGEKSVTPDGNTTLVAAADAAVEAETPPELDAAPATGDPAPPRKSPPKPSDLQELVNRAVRKRSPQFRACFEANPDLSRTIREVQLQFEVSAKGQVTAVKVLDATVASSKLGSCLTSVARATTFGRLPRALSFKIPLKTSVR